MVKYVEKPTIQIVEKEVVVEKPTIEIKYVDVIKTIEVPIIKETIREVKVI